MVSACCLELAGALPWGPWSASLALPLPLASVFPLEEVKVGQSVVRLFAATAKVLLRTAIVILSAGCGLSVFAPPDRLPYSASVICFQIPISR